MKKIFLFVLLLASSAAGVVAQESRQDVSISGFGLIEPYRYGSTTIAVDSNAAYGALASYRFQLTPSSALEANYGITYHNILEYKSATLGTHPVKVNTRTEEISAAYVRSFNFRRWNPFVEAGPGVMIFLPIIDKETTILGAKQQTNIAAFYGGGVAYELSPSFDIRAEYRGIITKVPNFGFSATGTQNLTTNKYWHIYEPVIGIAYHF